MIFSSLKMQRRLTQTKVYYKHFYSAWKETSHKPLKVAATKKSFSKVYISLIQLASTCFLFHVITGRHHFSHKFIVTQRFSTSPMLLRFLEQVFWKKSAFYIRYLHNNITMLLIRKVQNKTSTSYMFLRSSVSP